MKRSGLKSIRAHRRRRSFTVAALSGGHRTTWPLPERHSGGSQWRPSYDVRSSGVWPRTSSDFVEALSGGHRTIPYLPDLDLVQAQISWMKCTSSNLWVKLKLSGSLISTSSISTDFVAMCTAVSLTKKLWVGVTLHLVVPKLLRTTSLKFLACELLHTSRHCARETWSKPKKLT